MRPILGWCLLAIAAVGASGAVARKDIQDILDPDEQILREAGIKTDAQSLLAYLKSLCGEEADPKQLETLLQQLGSKQFRVREEATKKLVALKTTALPRLRLAQKDADLEIARRATACVAEIVKEWSPSSGRAAMRMLRQRPPEGTAAVLFRFLPHAGDEEVEEEIWFALDTLAARGAWGKEALAAGLHDSWPIRRAVAACLLGRLGDEKHRAAVRELLKDASPAVRLRAAQGLLAGKDPVGIPALVALLDEPAIDLAWQAEELLHWVAGETSPKAKVGAGTEPARRACKLAWEAWWKAHGPKVDLQQAFEDYRRPGLLLVCEADDWQERQGRVWLCGCGGEARWELHANATCVQLSPGNRIFTIEHVKPNDPRGAPRRVRILRERSLAGEVLWEPKLLDERGRALNLGTSVRSARRLPDGQIAVALGQNGALLLSEMGNRVAYAPRLPLQGRVLYTCDQFLSTDRVLCFGSDKGEAPTTLAEFDPWTGEEKRRIDLQEKLPKANYEIEAVAGGNYLIAGGRFAPEKRPSRVIEIDARGAIVWQFAKKEIRHALRLRNGNTLVSCADGDYNRILEVDAQGRIVWEAFAKNVPHRSQVCLGLVRLGFDRSGLKPFDLASSLPYRLQCLASANAAVRRGAVYDLKDAGPEAVAAVPLLIKLYSENDLSVQIGVSKVLRNIGAPGTPELLRTLKQGDTFLRHKVASILREKVFHSEAKAVVPALIEAFEDQEPSVRRMAVSSLGFYRQDADTAIPVILRGLSDPDETVRRHSVSALGTLGTVAEAALPVLLKEIKGKDRKLRQAIAKALSVIAPANREVHHALIEALRNQEDPGTRLGAARALLSFRPVPAAAVPALVEAAQAKDRRDDGYKDSIRTAAVMALGKVGAEAAAAVPLLISFVRDSPAKSNLQLAAVESLGEIGPKAAEAITALEEVSRQPGLLGKRAQAALAKIKK